MAVDGWGDISLSIGIDVEATSTLGALVDATGCVLASATARTPRDDRDALLAVLSSVVAGVSGDAGPQPVDWRSRVAWAITMVSPDLTVRVDWGEGAVVQRLAHDLHAPVTVANDAQAAAWGELQAGSTRALTHFMLLTVGTGLGGGIVIDGGHYRGATGASGQVGHPTIVNPDGRPCPCGKTGCWEQYASGTALVLEARAATAGLRRDLETGPPTIGEDLSLIVDIEALQTLALHIALDRDLAPTPLATSARSPEPSRPKRQPPRDAALRRSREDLTSRG